MISFVFRVCTHCVRVSIWLTSVISTFWYICSHITTFTYKYVYRVLTVRLYICIFNIHCIVHSTFDSRYFVSYIQCNIQYIQLFKVNGNGLNAQCWMFCMFHFSLVGFIYTLIRVAYQDTHTHIIIWHIQAYILIFPHSHK